MCRTFNDRTQSVGPVLLFFLVLTACSDEPTASEPSAQKAVADACALLTATEIEAATGIAPGPAVDVSQPQLPMCNWPTADGSNPAFLTLMIGPSGHYGSYDEAMEKWAASAADMDFPFDSEDYQEVDGVGDVGAWMPDAGILQAHTGATMVQIMTEVAGGRDPLEAARALARQVGARLP